MRALIFCLLVSGCSAQLRVKTLTEYARVLEATKSAYYVTCVQLITRPPAVDGRCDVAALHLDAAIELYMELRETN
jgi:hypothetical protein